MNAYINAIVTCNTLKFRFHDYSVESYTMKVEGIQKTEHHTGFSKIILKLIVKSHNITKDDLQKAVKLSEEKFCPVWSMIKNNVIVETEFQIER